MMPSLRRIALGVFAGVLLMTLAGFLAWPHFVEHGIDYKMPGNPQAKIVAARVWAIERREQLIDQRVWQTEIEAQEYGRVFEVFWDALNAATNKWDVVEELKFQELVPGSRQKGELLPHGIESWRPEKASASTTRESYDEWREKVSQWKQEGWGILQCEFRHNLFDPQTNRFPARSKFYFSVHLTNALPARLALEGDLSVEWAARVTNQPPSIRKIDASDLRVLYRAGPPAFVPIFTEAFDPPPLSHALDPLLVYDLDSDGIPEIVLPAANRIFRWTGDHYVEEKFCSTPRIQIWDGLFADMDGDGVADFLYVNSDGLFLLKGLRGGRFATPRPLISKPEDFFGAHALTCGDIDNDGDLDVFVGQYKFPFAGGSMPTPYYDANDGYPSHLYLNEGSGNFTDATLEAGLGPKRFRRVYSASFVDFDNDGALDLLVTSDFAGIDIYRNDGRGHFTDMTSTWLSESHLFGMGHTFGDFNNDGRLDFYVTGMTSPTAERLEHLALNRPGANFQRGMRARVISGSRLYYAGPDGIFEERAALRGAARTGWSWGVSAADFDNDGWLDLYLVNGMESMASVHDYDEQFWLHDIFVGDSREREVESKYFGAKMMARRRASQSYGGYDKNRLLLNQNGSRFANLGHLLGVALEDDCRNLVAVDLDGDGRLDLALVSEHALEVKERLRIFRNEIAERGNWIACAFREEPGRISPIGATVRVRGPGFEKIAAVVTGGSFRSQHPLISHFGLGNANHVDEVEIRWPGGAVTRLAGPEINQAHWIRAPKQ